MSENSAAVTHIDVGKAAVAGEPSASRKTPPAPAQRPSVAEKIGEGPVEQAQQLDLAIERLNELAQKNGRGLSFSLDSRLNREVITVKSSTTGELVRQIPSETVLRVAHAIEDFKGMFFDEIS